MIRIAAVIAALSLCPALAGAADPPQAAVPGKGPEKRAPDTKRDKPPAKGEQEGGNKEAAQSADVKKGSDAETKETGCNPDAASPGVPCSFDPCCGRWQRWTPPAASQGVAGFAIALSTVCLFTLIVVLVLLTKALGRSPV